MSNLGAKIDTLHSLREQKRAKEAEIKELEEKMGTLEFELLTELDAQGIEQAKGTTASIAVRVSRKPSVEDWDAFYAYINRNKYYHLLERRPSSTGCGELFDLNKSIPGVVPFVQRKIAIRST